MKKAFRIISKILSALLVSLVAFLAIFLVGIKLVGLTPYKVLSGSMEPFYHVGSVIYVKTVEADKLVKGDPVTFYLADGTIATHRIVEVVEDKELGRYYRTQGDNNNLIDGDKLMPKEVIGKPVFSIPYLGYVASYIKTPFGICVIIAVCAAVLMLSLLTEQKESDGSDAEPENEAPDSPTSDEEN